MWGVAVENLGDLAEARLHQMAAKTSQPFLDDGARLRPVAMHAAVGAEVRPHQPRPNGSLMIGRVAAAQVAFVTPAIARVERRQGAQAVGSEQVFLHPLQNRRALSLVEHRMRQAGGEDLVGADRAVANVAAHDVVETLFVIVPKHAAERFFGEGAALGIVRLALGVAESGGQVAHHAQGVVPKRLHLHRFPAARGDDEVADLGVHPGQLGAFLAAFEKPVGAGVDTEQRAALVPGDDLAKNGVKVLPHELHVARVFDIRADGFEIPKGCVDGVIFGRAGFGEAVGKQPLVDVLGEDQQKLARHLRPAGVQR